MTVEEYVNRYVDSLKVGQHFQARTVARAFYALTYKDGKGRLPYADTIQRTLRRRRSERNDVNYFDKGKSIWWKNDHVATAEERDAYRKGNQVI